MDESRFQPQEPGASRDPLFSRLRRGGRMTKWKGQAASYAPHVAQLVSAATRALRGALGPAAVLAGLAASPAGAVDFYWDGGIVDGGNPLANAQGGPGTWNTTTTNWDTAATGGGSVAWVNGNNNAFFSGSQVAQTVTLGEAITAHNLTFSVGGYTLTGSTLTLTGAGAAIAVSFQDGATINSAIAGTDGLNKTAAGTLVLGGTNTGLTGGITVTGGTLRLQGTNSANGANNVIYVNTGTGLQVNSSNAFGGDTAASRLQMETGSAFEIMSNLTVAHDITLVEAGSLAIIGNGTWNGTVTLNGDATLRFGSGTLTVNGDLSDNNGFVTGLEVIAGGSVVTFNGDLSHTGGLAVRDRALLAGANTYSGDTIVASGTANLATLTYLNAGAISANSNVVLGDAVSVGLAGFGYSPANITLGTGGGQFRFAGDGGFVSRPAGVDVVLSLNGGAGLTWGAGNFIGTGDTLYLGTSSTGATARELRLTNNIDLGGQHRAIFAYLGSIADHGVLSGTLSGAGGLQVVGDGLLELRGTNSYTGATEVQSTLMLGSGGAINGGIGFAGGQSNLQLNGISGNYANDGIVVLTAASGDFLRGLGTGGDQVQWLSDGGFTAVGGDRTVNIGNGAALTWGQGGFVGDGDRLVFGGGYGNAAINFQNDIDLGSQNRTIEVNNIATNLVGLYLNGVISGSGALILDGTGDVALTGLNTFTGNAVLGSSGANDMEVTVATIGNAGVAGNLGAGTTIELRSNDNGVLSYTGAGESTNRNWLISVTNGGNTNIQNNGSGALQLTGNITKDGGGASNRLALQGTFASSDSDGDGIADDANIISGVISETSGTLAIELSGSAGNTWRFTGENTYSGTTTIHNTRVLEVDDLANGGQASSIGDSSNAASNLNIIGTLRYIGTGDSTDRLMLVNGPTHIESSGTGALQFTNTGLVVRGSGAGDYNITFGGTNTDENVFAPTLTNLEPGLDHLTIRLGITKDGPGLWALNTNNNAQVQAYTDNTTITGGALKLNHAGAITGGLGTASSHGAAGSSQRSSMILFNGTATTGGVIGLTAASGSFTRGLTLEADSFLTNGTTPNVEDDDTYVQGVRWAGSGGFAAWDGTQIVNLGGAGAQVTWNVGGFVTNNNALIFGYETANGTVDFQNAVSLVNAARTVRTNNGSAAVDAIMSGVISGTGTSASLVKEGAGTLALTAANTYQGVTTINAGTLQIGNNGTTGTLGTGAVSLAAGAAIDFKRSNIYQQLSTNTITGPGTLIQSGTGTTELTAANNSVGATLITAGTLQVNAGSTLTTPTLTFNQLGASVPTLTVAGTVQAAGATPVAIAGDNGASAINISSGGLLVGNGDLGGGADTVTITGTLNTGAGVLNLGGGGDTLVLNNTATLTGIVDGGAGTDTLQVNNTADRTIDAAQVPNFEALTKTQTGLLTLTGDHNYSAGTTISGGELRIGNGGTSGTIGGGPIVNNSALSFNRDGTLIVAGLISGTGSVTQMGLGTTILTGNNTYGGPTNVNGGTLIIDGTQSGGGQVTVASGATLGGNGTVGGPVVIANGGTLAPGSAGDTPGSLTIAGNLTLNSSSSLAYNFGQANTVGGPLNDHTQVNGNLRLDGTLDMTVSAGGTFAPGFYRVFTYTGSLDNQGLALGPSVPGGVAVDTSTTGQVNLLNTAGQTLTFWDGGTAGNHFDDVAQGGDGVWQSPGGNVNWTDQPGNGTNVNAPWTAAAFAVFQGSAGTVTVDNAPATVTTSGMQFRVTGYEITGEPLTLVPLSPGSNAVIRVGEGAPTDAGITATISAELTGGAGLTKTDGGRLILTAANSYAGVTQIEGGVVQISAEDRLGANAGMVLQGGTLNTTSTFTLGKNIALNGPGGALDVNGATTLTAIGAIDGAGALTKLGTGTLILSGGNSYSGGTSFNAGVVSISADYNLGTGPLTFNGGTLRSTGIVDLAMGGTINAPGGTIDTLPGDLTIAGNLLGAGALTKTGVGRLILTGANTYAGGTTVSDGRLQLGNNTASGSITGDVVVNNNGELGFARTDDYVFDGVISGTGSVVQLGDGTTTLTGANTYTGETNVLAGTLLVNGNQSGAIGATNVLFGTVGGTGTIGGDVTVYAGGTLAPGDVGAPGTLTINGSLRLAIDSTLAYQFGQPNVVGGGNNDHTIVAGDLDMQGAEIDVSVTSGGTFGPGIYRVITYSGNLVNAGLTLGDVPVDSDLSVDTATTGQVNLVNTFGTTLNYWDGSDPANFQDGEVNGGSGTWQASGGNNDWTGPTGDLNAGWADEGFAIFQGEDGTVEVDNSNGAVTASGMQFLVSGYTISGQPLTLVPYDSGSNAIIRVGSGAPDDASLIATISAELTGTAGLTKTDGGRLILTAANTYQGVTVIEGGVIQVAAEAALGTNASLVLQGGALNTTTSFALDKDITLEGPGGALDVNDATTLELTGTLAGSGELRKTGTGTLLQSIPGADTHSGATTVAQGTLLAGNAGVLSTASAYSVLSGATLDLDGFDQTIASLNNAGAVRLEGAPGTTLTLTGNYTGSGGTIYLNTALGNDASPTDRLAVGGDTSGSSILAVTNVGGTGAPTVEGIKLVDVAGTSAGTFSLQGDYVFEGQQAVVGGAYAYRLYQGSTSAPNDGDWYLRSALIDGEEGPLLQPGVPIYEAYAGVLQTFNQLGTLQQRLGNRSWTVVAQGADAISEEMDVSREIGIWARIEGAHADFEPEISTSGADYDVSLWRLTGGVDTILTETASGQLIGGVAAHVGTVSSHVESLFGNGSIDATGYGVSGSLTWYGNGGFYVDGQAQVTGYDSDLFSSTAGVGLVEGNNGFGYALGVEVGQRVPINPEWAITPQAQLTWSSVDYDDFDDVFGAEVSLVSADALIGRLGLAVDRQTEWVGADGTASRTHLYGIGNLYYDFEDGTSVDVAGTPFDSEIEALWGGLGVGGSYSWADDKYALYGEALAKTSLENFGDSHVLSGSVGFRASW